MTKGRPKTFKYKYNDYDDTVRKLLDIKLNDDDIIKLNMVQENFRNINAPRGYEYILKDLFILVEKHNISTSDISKIYGVGVRMVQVWLKEIGLNRSVKQGKNINNTLYLSPKNQKIDKTNYNSSIYLPNYTKEIIQLLEGVELTEDELSIICKLKKNNIEKKYYLVIDDLYKLYKLNFTPTEIALIFNKSTRTIQMIMKSLQLNRDRYYSTQIKYSDTEGYIRMKLNLDLSSILSEYEVIVGVNSLEILDSEINIPIIIIKNSEIYKFAIEVNGFYTHNDEYAIKKNKIKEISSKEKKYEFITINTKPHYNHESDFICKESIDKEIQFIIKNITKKIKFKIRNGD